MNQVVLSTNTVPRSVFKEFTQPKNGFYMTASKEEEEEKKKKGHALGITLAASALIVGFGTLALMKGIVPKSLTKHLDKWKLQLEKKVEKGSDFQSFYQKALDVVTNLSKKSKGINNITSLKDVLFKRLMCGKDGNRPITSSIHNGITKIFTKISRNTVNSSYAKTQKKLAALNEYLYSINSKFLAQNPANKERLIQIEKNILKVNNEYEKGFGINARNQRHEAVQKALDELFEQFWGKSFGNIKNNFKSKDMYQSFIAENILQVSKNSISQRTDIQKKSVVDTIETLLKAYKSVLPESEYTKTNKHIKSVIKSLDKSIETENIKYFDKARDLKLGSAPTDVLSIASGLGAVSWFAAKSKDKDERISAVLNYGIPAIGAIATSLYCSARLISGGKGFALGLLSGWVINKIGAAADEARKKYSVDISLINKTLLKPQSDNL